MVFGMDCAEKIAETYQKLERRDVSLKERLGGDSFGRSHLLVAEMMIGHVYTSYGLRAVIELSHIWRREYGISS